MEGKFMQPRGAFQPISDVRYTFLSFSFASRVESSLLVCIHPSFRLTHIHSPFYIRRRTLHSTLFYSFVFLFAEMMVEIHRDRVTGRGREGVCTEQLFLCLLGLLPSFLPYVLSHGYLDGKTSKYKVCMYNVDIYVAC